MITTVSSGSVDEAVRWVQQDERLWTGRMGGRPIGTVERGRRFTYLDLDGVPSPGHRTLEEAQRAHATRDPAVGGSATPRPAGRLLVGASTVAAFGAVALVAAAAPVLIR